ncbi:MAG: ferredoxin reductase family protein [Acidimicrobiales bacterium]
MLAGSQDQRETVAVAVIVAGALAVVGVWWGDTPGRSLHTFADRLTAGGRITGLLGTYLVLVQVMLMARLPWLDRFIGTDRLSAWHRVNGGYTIGMLVAHAALTVWGYAVADHVSLAHETSAVIRSYPDMLSATVGLALLVGVGVSSARIARRRLKHETWYFVHLYTYVAIALSFSHQLATGNDFVTHPANRLLWVALYTATFAVLIVFRFVVPLRDFLRYRLRVASVVAESGGAVSVYVTGRGLDRMHAQSGQFFRWRFLSRDRWWQAHPFSLSAAPRSDVLRITVKGVGDHTRAFGCLRPGTLVMAEGPYGNFTARRRTRPKVLLIAGGVGITPLRALLEDLPAVARDVTLVYRASRESDLLLRSELEALCIQHGSAVHYILGRREKNRRAISPARLRGLVPDVVERDVYLCGPPGMMDEAAKSLRSLGVARAQLHRERFEL